MLIKQFEKSWKKYKELVKDFFLCCIAEVVHSRNAQTTTEPRRARYHMRGRAQQRWLITLCCVRHACVESRPG